MDLSIFDLDDLLLAAIKSEVESRTVYEKLADIVENAYLKDRLTFLAGEEKRHRLFIEGIFEKEFPGEEIVLPEKTPVPLPVMKMPGENTLMSEVVESAMEAEKASNEFYKGLVESFDDQEIKKTLLYFAAMEMNHYRILEAEQENMKRFENFDVEWPMMNVGP
jgi:rubrerythrin